MNLDALEGYIRNMHRLEMALEDIGDSEASREVEHQMIQLRHETTEQMNKLFFDAGTKMARLRQLLRLIEGSQAESA